MKIENTTTEEITKLLCQVMESKAGQTDGEIVDEFEKKLKQKYCDHFPLCEEHMRDLSMYSVSDFGLTVDYVCTKCGAVIQSRRFKGVFTDSTKL
jgi:hypothetical protein